ncbi:S8 family peptidase [Aquimarina sp. RZ0]|uniref:S8 family peptidase n=1 Tax=Aquimarina sp. RZ0 TaxID=2607730 RepID=UPI0011F3B8BA|nr:S8 family peptidase [Aquimarina sp. RZ0]KAA1244764.1 S8 family serine peptidase [Aquimarina sp. RZ0]
MKKIIILIAIVLLNTWIQAQQPKHIPGEILVKLEGNYTGKSLLEDSKKLHLPIHKSILVSKSLNIWKFSFDQNKMDIDQMIQRVYKNKKAVIVQANHILKKRSTTPNDVGYRRQWQYFQSNDKDIDADEAWDITTGGTTADGREIVVAVIDDGMQFDHPDLVDNLWTNSQEIPGNNIDDDGNGYIDDVKGWSTITDNDDIKDGGHGTSVSGIVGAKGNNSIGVSGVNWDVKIMVVEIGNVDVGNVEGAIKAYTYILDNRKLYNETNGAKGAFVVCTNASFGVDFGKPEDAPLWCELYDTLGKHGILNAGATINEEENVDVVGDLPTSCPSEFLISVTNIAQDDIKLSEAGYGAETIDLGAPGEGVYTTASGNSYATFGGTSGATPHVAGTIALLYAAPSVDFANLAIQDPEEAARKVKSYILENTDPNTSLDGITVTGGRLNTFKSLQALMDDQVFPIDDVQTVFSDELILYPNPATDLINFKTRSNATINSVVIHDTKGKVIKSYENSSSADISDLSKGSYIIRYQLKGAREFKYTLFLKR